MTVTPRSDVAPAPALGSLDACQSCAVRELRSVLFLGYLPPVNRLRALDAPHDAEEWYPADLRFCPACRLAQLGYAVDPAVLFPPEYPYTSGTTRVLRENFADLARELAGVVPLADDDLIVDIGSNDGTLLSNFRDRGNRVLGIEPTLTAELARERGIPTLMTFFGPDVADTILSEYGRPAAVTAANVFAHIPDVHTTLGAIAELAGGVGVFVSESHYLGDLVRTLQYDTIYHEHLRYYSLTSLSALLERHGLRVFDVRRIPTHGGSIRVYASRSDRYAVHPRVGELLVEEAGGVGGDAWVEGFRERVARSKLDLYALLRDVRAEGATVYGIGAPSRATTLIHYVGLDESLVACVLEVAGSKKVGQYLPGTSIPVLDEAKLYEDQPAYALLLSWHIADELSENLRRRGYRGRFIVPLPEPRFA